MGHGEWAGSPVRGGGCAELLVKVSEFALVCGERAMHHRGQQFFFPESERNPSVHACSNWCVLKEETDQMSSVFPFKNII